MPLRIENGHVFFGDQSVPAGQFTELVHRYLRKNPATTAIEIAGTELIGNQFPHESLAEFIHSVCRWGGYTGIAGRVTKRNTRSRLKAAFSAATDLLNEAPPDVELALRTINSLYGLGTPSFASKHLRFLKPQVCPVLDSIIHKRLGCAFTPNGYKQFSETCIRVGIFLSQSCIENPMRRNDGAWYAADVEMGVFSQLRGW